MANKKSGKIGKKILCECCDYTARDAYDYEKHLATQKHSRLTNATKNREKSGDEDSTFICKCGKNYKHTSSLYKHKKDCDFLESKDESKDEKENALIMMLVKQNSELLEVIKNGTHNTNSHNKNSHNKTFNLQFFLNETCKDAMNITDFVNSIKVTLMDLEKVGEIGYVEGISNIITSNLKALDVTQRPIHCTDNKREVLYVKDEDKWEKEADEKKKVRKAIKSVANKNMKMIATFQEVHPECMESESEYSEQYNKIILESFGGSGENNGEKEDKIIQKIAKDVVIDK